MIRKGYDNIAAFAGMLEIIVHSALSTYYVGWNSGFHIYVITLIPLIFYSSRSTMAQKLSISVLAVAAYEAMSLTMQEATAVYSISTTTLSLVNFSNYAIFFILLSTVTQYYCKAAVAAEARLDRMSRVDELTKLSNRRHMIEKLKHEQMRFALNHKPFSILITDIDDFKHINDEFGHDFGDFVLSSIANAFSSEL
jgi:GGDEF domain-containing protein